MNDIFSTLAAAAAANERVALGILTRVNGSSPQKSGAKAIFHADGKITGTLGGGCLEAEAQRLALNALKTGKPETFELVLDHDFGWDDGLICGGKVLGVIIPNAQNVGENFWNELTSRETTKTWCVNKDFSIALADGGASVLASQLVSSLAPPKDDGAHGVTRPTDAPTINHQPSTINSPDFLYTETITPPCALWIAGSGHVAQAVAPLALQLDFAVSIFDDRPELANHEFFPKQVSLHTGNWGEVLAAPMPSVPTFGLIVTRGHNHDALVLESWIRRPFAFLGMIGSQRKWRVISEKFQKANLATAEELARVACPVGIKIAAKSVPEIAVSIVAQFIEKRAGAESSKHQHPSFRE